MTSEIKVDTISEQTSANGVTIDGLTIKDGNIIGDVALAGTTPTFTIGDAGAEDAALIFDGNAQDFYIALDDSADDLIIGLGATVGTTPMLSFTEAKAAAFTGAVSMATTLTLTGNADFNGALDVDGTTNLDVVDIDGAVNMATTALVTGVLTTTAATVFNGGFTANDGSIITTADNTDTLTLTSTDADGASGPILKLFRNSASAVDGDNLGFIKFFGKEESDGDEAGYVQLQGKIVDSAAGSPDGALNVEIVVNNSGKSAMLLGPTEAVFNNDSIDIDFRVESNGNANMIFVDGGNNHVCIGTATDHGGVLNVDGPILMSESDTLLLRITSSGSDVKFQNRVSNKDISFEGIDGSSAITALHLDMATAGTATFNDNIVMGTAGKGIHLGVTSATAANLLDDYEEGTYTPTFTVASGSLTVHSSHNTLAYTKIGRVVHVQGEVRFSAISSPSGNFSLSLPFAVADLAEGAARFTSAPIGQSGFNGTPNQTYYGSVKGEGVDTMFISTHNSGSDTGVNANQVTTNTEMIFSFTMIAA